MKKFFPSTIIIPCSVFCGSPFSDFDSAEPFGPELTVDGLVAGWPGASDQKPEA